EVECLQALDNYAPVTELDDTKHFLQTFVDNLPLSGNLTLMSQIVEHARDSPRLRQLRNFLADAIFKPGLKSPAISTAVAPEFKEGIDTHIALAKSESSSRNRQTSLRQRCLVRDNNSCVVTHAYEENYFSTSCIHDRVGALRTPVNCTHILPCNLTEVWDGKCANARKTAVRWWAF
ncbi:hypothetical protein QBC36DRAFT_164641, partial [Triangularia setosa]